MQSMIWRGFVVGLRFRSCFQPSMNAGCHTTLKCLPQNKVVHFFSKSCFFGLIQSLEQWNLSKGSNVVICGSIRTFYVVCKGGGWNFEPLQIETSKYILFPLKDSTSPWPHPLFAHLGYGLVLPCCLMVEGQIHHIG